MAHPFQWFLLLCLVGCQASLAMRPAHCSTACLRPSRAVTAAHCIHGPGAPGLVEIPDEACGPVRSRRPVEGERVTVSHRSGTFRTVVRYTVGDRAALEGVTDPGTSGAGVYASDGALVGIVQSRTPGLTWADVPPGLTWADFPPVGGDR